MPDRLREQRLFHGQANFPHVCWGLANWPYFKHCFYMRPLARCQLMNYTGYHRLLVCHIKSELLGFYNDDRLPEWNCQHWSPVASFTMEVNLQLAKRPLVLNGYLANPGLTSLVNEATGDMCFMSRMPFSWVVIPPDWCWHCSPRSPTLIMLLVPLLFLVEEPVQVISTKFDTSNYLRKNLGHFSDFLFENF